MRMPGPCGADRMYASAIAIVRPIARTVMLQTATMETPTTRAADMAGLWSGQGLAGSIGLSNRGVGRSRLLVRGPQAKPRRHTLEE